MHCRIALCQKYMLWWQRVLHLCAHPIAQPIDASGWSIQTYAFQNCIVLGVYALVAKNIAHVHASNWCFRINLYQAANPAWIHVYNIYIYGCHDMHTASMGPQLLIGSLICRSRIPACAACEQAFVSTIIHKKILGFGCIVINAMSHPIKYLNLLIQ